MISNLFFMIGKKINFGQTNALIRLRGENVIGPLPSETEPVFNLKWKANAQQ
jgi:hypothetical protein